MWKHLDCSNNVRWKIAALFHIKRASTMLTSAIATFALCVVVSTTANASPPSTEQIYQSQVWNKGQSITAAGVLTDIFDHPVTGANVTLAGNITYQTKTNRRGEYIFPAVKSGTYSIIFEHDAFLVVALHNVKIQGTKDSGFLAENGEKIFFRVDCPMLPVLPDDTETRDNCIYTNGERIFNGTRRLDSWASWSKNHEVAEPKTGLIMGNVLDPRGNGVADVDVIISLVSESSSFIPYTVHVTTARNGVYSAVVSQGKYEIRMNKGGYFPTSGFRDVSTFSHFNAVIVPAHAAPEWLVTLTDNAWKVIATQAFFWVLLIFFYPVSPKVQAFFFWNRWARKAFGLMYVDVLLTWVPFLRSRLLAPFRGDLIAEALVQDKSLGSYFPECDVAEIDGNNRMNINEAIGIIHGQIVLEGESGLGKSMFLRRLVVLAQSPHVYLKAESCEIGVMEAVQQRLKGRAGDEAFLKSIIYTGGLTFVIDGLNEVTVEVREKIVGFINSYSKANIIVATQPMQWRPPPAATLLRLMPLAEAKILDFLQSRYGTAPTRPVITPSQYNIQCMEYVDTLLAGHLTPDERCDALRQLSNPMDLTTAANILLRGGIPTLGNLQQQEFAQMETAYKRNNGGQAFPIRSFSEHVYAHMVRDEVLTLDSDEFLTEIVELLCFKMVLELHSEDEKGVPVRRWVFRHEKIRDFFLMQAFRNDDGKRILEHLDDVRFRNVYIMLASMLPLDQASTLKEALVDRAADTKEHHLSDAVVQVLRTRRTTTSGVDAGQAPIPAA